jgi:hypothetical protein
MDTIALIVLAPLPVMLLATRSLVASRGARRWPRAAPALWALPALGYLGWAALFFRDVLRDPTSHNLWPFEIAALLVWWALYAMALRLGFWIAEFRARRRAGT